MNPSKTGFQMISMALGLLCLQVLFANIIQAAEGDQEWAFQTAGRVASSPAIGTDGTIYVGSGDKRLYAVNPDGTEKWSFLTGGIVYSSPAIGFDNTVYFGSGDHKIYALNPNGIRKWAFETGGSVECSPAVGIDGTIYVASYDNKVYAINPDGTEKWIFETGNYVYSSPAIGSDTTIYVGSQDGKLYAIDAEGNQKWVFTTVDHVNSSPSIGLDGTVYVGTRDGKLYAISEQGAEQWAFETGGRVESSPAIGSDGTIYVGSEDRKFYAINPDGTQKWTFETGRSVESSPAIGADGTIYVGSQDKKFYAINADGTSRWTFETENWVQSSPVIGNDGTVYVGSHDNRLFAIEGSSGGLVASPWPKFRHDIRGTGFWVSHSDTTPPAVDAIDPANSTSDVDVETAITATFSEAMQPLTITSGTFFVRDGSDLVLGTVTYSETMATFTPEADLNFETDYVATITVGALDLAGNSLDSNVVWSFTTGSNPDAVPPAVTATSPANNATGVDVSSIIIATFSEPMNPATITAATFLVNDGTTNIAGSVSCSGSTATFILTPPTFLDYDTDYVVTITDAAEDLAGNTLLADYTWSFATESAPDTEPPTVDATTPANDATDVALNTAVTGTFSEDMDVSTIDETTFFVDGGAGQIEGTVSYSGSIAVFTPATLLDYETNYTATITTGARDISGNAFQSDYSWTFITEDAPLPTISVIPLFLSPSCFLGNSPPSDGVTLWNSGGGDLNYTITDNAAWLSCIPANGTSGGEQNPIAINYETSGLNTGTYSATITFHASEASNDPATIAVTLVVGSQPPLADAGPEQRVDEGDMVTLDSSNSVDVDDGIATYYWEQTDGPIVALSSETAVQPTFAAPDEGPDGESLMFRLTVTDRGSRQATDTCIVNVSSVNEPPVAYAGGDQRVVQGDLVTLDGSDSTDQDDGVAAYLWEQTAGPVVVLSDETAAKPTFTAPEEGADGVSLTFQLTVTDNSGLRSKDTCIVNVSSLNEPPTAHAGTDQNVDEGDTVTLDGSGSTDSDNGIAFTLWRQTSGIPVTLSSPTAARPTFVAPPVGTGGARLVFRLTVSDHEGLGACDEISVAIDDNGITGFPKDVITFFTSTGEDMGVELAGDGNCTNLQAVDPSAIADTVNRPRDLVFGLIAMQIAVHTIGGAVDVTVHLPYAAPDGYGWYKYGTGWYDFSDHAVFNGDRTQVTLNLVDGGAGDQDSVANGIIVDPGGLGLTVLAPSAPSAPSAPVLTVSGGGDGGGGGGGGCFVAAVGHSFSVVSGPVKIGSFVFLAPLSRALRKLFVRTCSIPSKESNKLIKK